MTAKKAKKNKLTKKQRSVLDDIFACDTDEMDVLARHGVKTSNYRNWLASRTLVTR